MMTVPGISQHFMLFFFSPMTTENLQHLPNAAPQPVQLRVPPTDPPAQVSLHLPWVWNQLPVGPLPVSRYQELPALHTQGRLPVSTCFIIYLTRKRNLTLECCHGKSPLETVLKRPGPFTIMLGRCLFGPSLSPTVTDLVDHIVPHRILISPNHCYNLKMARWVRVSL